MVKHSGAHVEVYESGKFPEGAAEAFENMGKFNETLMKDGWVVDMGGLKPTSAATRIDFSGGKPRTTDGPFSETKELVGGFWLLDAPSKEALVERMQHCPFPFGETVEIRPLHSQEDLDKLV
jgi:hypothetical protein